MSTVRVRPKHQITLPTAIINQAGLHPNDLLEASYVNGVITLVPKGRPMGSDDLMAYAGIAEGLYGKTREEIDENIRQMHDEWER